MAALGALRVAAADVGRASAAGEGPAVCEVVDGAAPRAGDEVSPSAPPLHANQPMGWGRGLKFFPKAVVVFPSAAGVASATDTPLSP